MTRADRAAVADAQLVVSPRAQNFGLAYLVRGDGRRRVLRHDTAYVRFSADARRIAYLERTGRTSRQYGPVLQLVTARRDGRDRVVFHIYGLKSKTWSVDQYGLSPDGRRVIVALADLDDSVFPGAPLDGRYVVAERDGRDPLLLQRCEVGDGPAFSPDGQRVAFACRLWPPQILNAAGPARHRPYRGETFTEGKPRASATVGVLAWRPDGRALAYALEGPSGTPDLVLTAVPGSRRIGQLAHAGGFSWSPDGRYYATTPRYGERPSVTITRASDNRTIRTIPLGPERQTATELTVQWAP